MSPNDRVIIITYTYKQKQVNGSKKSEDNSFPLTIVVYRQQLHYLLKQLRIYLYFFYISHIVLEISMKIAKGNAVDRALYPPKGNDLAAEKVIVVHKIHQSINPGNFI